MVVGAYSKERWLWAAWLTYPHHDFHHDSALTSEAAIEAAVQGAGYRCRHLKTDVAAPSKNQGTSGFHGQVSSACIMRTCIRTRGSSCRLHRYRAFVRPLLTTPRHTSTRRQQFTLAVGGMSCAACSGKIERIVNAMPGVQACAVSLSTQVGPVGARPSITCMCAPLMLSLPLPLPTTYRWPR